MLMADRFVRQPRTHIGDDRDRRAVEAQKPRQNHLGHGGHAHRIGAQNAGGADLSRGLEAWAREPAIDPLGQIDAFGLGGSAQTRPNHGIMRGGHRHEARIRRLADQGIGAREIDMIRQQHQRSGRHLGAQAARRIGQDQPPAPQRLQQLQRRAHGIGAAGFIVMRPPAQHGHPPRLQLTDHQLRHMPRNPRMRKARQV